ncbi:MAG: hypothetical protein AAF609_18535 [Cyanobacteria bacterium P01_C01_bin.120]
MTRQAKAKRQRLCKGFDDPGGGGAGHHSGHDADKNPDTSGHDPDTTRTQADKLPELIAQAVGILRTAERSEGKYSAAAISQVCGCDDSTVRNRWFKSLNSEIANESTLKAINGKFTELAMRLFAEIADCSLTPAEWVLQVLRPALLAMPNERCNKPEDKVTANPYTTALARRKAENEAASTAADIEFEELKRQREAKQIAGVQLSDAELNRIRIEEKQKLVNEEKAREQIRQELMAELGIL